MNHLDTQRALVTTGKEVVQPGMEVVEGQQNIPPLPPTPSPHWGSNDMLPSKHDETAYTSRQDINQKICGLERSSFFIILTTVLIILSGAAIGGGVGGYFAGKSHRKDVVTNTPNLSASTIQSLLSSATASPSSSNPSTVSTNPGTVTPTPGLQFPESGILDNSCPSADKTTYSRSVSTTVYNFQIYCGVNYLASVKAIAGSNATTIEDCMNNCAWDADRLGNCKGIVFQGNLTEAEKPNQLANCWLVDSTAAGSIGSADGTIAGAVLTGKTTAV